MNRLGIAILDSGVNPAHRQVGPVAGGVRILREAGRARPGGSAPADWADGIGHGTAVAAAVSEDLPEDGYALWSVRIFVRRLDAPPACLAAGIRWAAERGARLVNLSAGVPPGEADADLRAACLEAGATGVTLVAPRADRKGLLCPGASDLPGVVAVEADSRLERGELRRRGRVLLASPWARPLPPLPRERNFSGASLAVAGVTNRAARLLLRGTDGNLEEALLREASARPG